jgi:hypothetical protein
VYLLIHLRHDGRWYHHWWRFPERKLIFLRKLNLIETPTFKMTSIWSESITKIIFKLCKQDRHGISHSVPIVDAHEDWTLVEFSETAVRTLLKVSRLLNTCDAEDLPITVSFGRQNLQTL